MGFVSGLIKNFIYGLCFMLGLMAGGYVLYKIAMHFVLGWVMMFQL